MRHPSRRAVDLATQAMAPEENRLQAIVESLDEFVHAMERKWGVDRLQLLVPDELRARWEAQKERLDAAIRSNQERYVATQADGMRRAWAALERVALAAGEQPLSPLVWECVLPSTGEVIS